MKPPATRAKGKSKEGLAGIDLTHEETWGGYLALLFNGLAELTGHEHWRKTDGQIEMVAIPAARIAREQVPKELLDKAQKGQNVVALLVGIALLVVPSLLAEWHIYRSGGEQRSTPPAPRAGEPAQPAATVERPTRTIPDANPRSPLASF